jgi:hypothetical protein
MSVRVTIICDNCDESAGDWSLGWTNAAECREAMAEVGWAHVGRKDYCPEIACRCRAADHQLRLTGSSSLSKPVPKGMQIREVDGRWELVPVVWALRCANGDIHTEQGEVVTAEEKRDATEAAAFMDDSGWEGPPVNCGPHVAVLRYA